MQKPNTNTWLWEIRFVGKEFTFPLRNSSEKANKTLAGLNESQGFAASGSRHVAIFAEHSVLGDGEEAPIGTRWRVPWYFL